MESTNNSEGSASAPTLSKACESCRMRKIRCNRAFPCSNCETAGITCTPASRIPDNRPRVPLSTAYEKQIEQINDRLSGIEDALRNLQLSKKPLSPDGAIESTPSTRPTPDPGWSQVETPATFEGESSFNSQAIRASQAAETSLYHISASADVVDALGSLRNLVESHNSVVTKQDMRLDGSKESERPLPEIQLLPAKLVLRTLQEYKSREPALFLAFGFRDWKSFERICQQVYFPTEPVSLTVLTLMHGTLLYLLKQVLMEVANGLGDESGMHHEFDIETYYQQAVKNFRLGVETYEVMAYPSLETVKVLMIAMLKAQEEGKPHLTWTFASTAVRQLLCMGYHRESSLKNDPPELADEKRIAFWTVYCFDKNTSYTLGYRSNLQDRDIDVGFWKISSDPGVAPWDTAGIALIGMSRLQGLIYEQLYSPSALNATAESRSRTIDDLSSRLEKWYLEWSSIDTNTASMPHLYFLTYGPFDVFYYSVLTSIHRAATSSSKSVEISSRCYDAAKKSLQNHLQFFPAFASYGSQEILISYVTWTLLYASWTPLIVVFLHAIASSNAEDVRLLEETEESLRPLKQLNTQSDQVYGLSRIFCKLARAFVERNSTFIGTYNSQEDTIVMPQFEMQQQNFVMGLPNMPFGSQMYGQESAAGFDTSSEMDGVSMFLGNWLGANQPVANLWNMDFSSNAD